MKLLTALLLAASLLAGSAYAAIPQVVLDFYQQNVWKVHNRKVMGTAWHLSPTLLVTNKHVVESDDPEEEPTQWFVERDGLLNQVPVEVLWLHPTRDIAILECLTCPLMGDIVDSEILITPIPLGTIAWGGGYGMGLFSIHVGMTQSQTDRWIFYDTLTSPGDSGSPLITLFGDRVIVIGMRTGAMTSSGHPVYHKGVAVKGIDILNYLMVLLYERQQDGNN